MGVPERKIRQRAEREERIVAAAAAIAEQDGWDAVTIRRLAEAIEYSQPVLYSHFANRDAIVEAVAIEGFRELATVLRAAADTGTTARAALANVAVAYLDFARSRSALYQAMFVLPTGLRFAEEENTRSELHDGFNALAAVITPFFADADVATEVFWSALHGMAELERAGRVKPAARQQRIRLIARIMSGSGDASRNSKRS